jgi:hypothetical protein
MCNGIYSPVESDETDEQGCSIYLLLATKPQER